MKEDTLVSETSATPRKPEPIHLPTPHDHKIVADALELRKEDLKALAKKNRAEGYSREASVMDADALALEHHILPAFRSQRELPLVTHEQLSKNIETALKVPIFRAFDQLGDPKIKMTHNGIMTRRDNLLDFIAKRVVLYVKDVAEEAYRQGMAARQQTPEVIADRAIMTLRATGD
jgi:hypothetical protein